MAPREEELDLLPFLVGAKSLFIKGMTCYNTFFPPGAAKRKEDPMKKSVDPVVLISLVTAVSMVGDSALYIMLPMHWKDFGLTELWQIGVLLAANRLVRLPLNPLVGKLYSRLSVRMGMLMAITLAIVTTAGYGLLRGFWALLLLRCLWGLAWTFLRLGAYFTILETAESSRRGEEMGRYNGLYRLGSLAGMLTGGFLADTFGVTAACLFFAAVSSAAIPFVWISVPKGAGSAAPSHEGDNSFSFRQNFSILGVLLIGTAIAFVYQGMFMSSVSYLVGLHETAEVRLGAAAIGAASLAGIIQAIRWTWEPWLAPFFGRMADGSWGRRKSTLASCGAGAALFLLATLPMPTALWLLLIMGVQVTATALTTLSDTIASDVAAASARVKIMTLYSVLTDLGAALGPMAAYAASQYVTPYASCYLAAAMLLAAGGWYGKEAERDKR